jgi:hypothetical protein
MKIHKHTAIHFKHNETVCVGSAGRVMSINYKCYIIKINYRAHAGMKLRAIKLNF